MNNKIIITVVHMYRRLHLLNHSIWRQPVVDVTCSLRYDVISLLRFDG